MLEHGSGLREVAADDAAGPPRWADVAPTLYHEMALSIEREAEKTPGAVPFSLCLVR